MDRRSESDPPNEDELRAFVVRKLGDLQAEFAKLIATLNLLTPVQAGQLAGRNRHLLYVLIGLVLILLIVLILHAAGSAGWLR